MHILHASATWRRALLTALVLQLLIVSAVELSAQSGHWETASSNGFSRRWDCAAAEVDGKIYVFGGYNDDDVLVNTFEVYDPQTDAWSTLPTEGINARGGHTMASIGSKIYVMGGGSNTGLMSAVDVFDVTAGTWSRLQTTGAMRARWYHASAVLDGKIYVIAGNIDPSDIGSTEVLDVASATWSNVSRDATPRRGLSASVVNGTIYAIGGYSPAESTTGLIEKYDPASNTWSRVPTGLPVDARCFFSTSPLGSDIYIFGGMVLLQSGNRMVNSVQVYSTTTNTVTTIPIVGSYTPRVGMAAITLNNRIYTLGGGVVYVSTLNTNEVFIPSTSSVDASKRAIDRMDLSSRR